MKQVKLLFALMGVFFIGSSVASGNEVSLPYDRLVIFGDSLSDTGNCPEPFHFKFKNFKETPVSFNLYVPVSSPVKPALYDQPILTISPDWHYPSLSFLQETIPQQLGTIEGPQTTTGLQRVAYSPNWPLYFVYNAWSQDARLPLIPWQEAYHEHKASVSYNYAWASALATNDCAANDYTPMSCGDESNIFQQQQAYRHGKSTDLNGFPVPGLIKQVDMYAHDDFAKPHHQSTAYMIYAGGDDLSKALHEQFLHFKWIAFYRAIKYQIPDDVQEAVNRITQYQQQFPDDSYDIYVLTYFNISKIPYVYHFVTNAFLRFLLKIPVQWTSSTYSKQLIKKFSHSSDSHIHVIDLGGYINQLLHHANYKYTVSHGLACIKDPSMNYIIPSVNVGQCHYQDRPGEDYAFWNRSHFATAINQQVAYYLYQEIEKRVNHHDD